LQQKALRAKQQQYLSKENNAPVHNNGNKRRKNYKMMKIHHI